MQIRIHRPRPTCDWPPDNIALLERYVDWLLSGGTSQLTTRLINIPMAGHVLGLVLKPHPELDLDADLRPAMDYILAKRLPPSLSRALCGGLYRNSNVYDPLNENLGRDFCTMQIFFIIIQIRGIKSQPLLAIRLRGRFPRFPGEGHFLPVPRICTAPKSPIR